MTAVLPPYDPEATCSKCGHDVATSMYRPPCGDQGCTWLDHVERIIRTCRRCGYAWDEAVLTPAEAQP